MDGFFGCPSALDKPMTGQQCYHSVARTCQTPRIVINMPANVLWRASEEGTVIFVDEKLMVIKPLVDAALELFVPKGTEVVRMVSIELKQEFDPKEILTKDSPEEIQVSFAKPDAYCAQCAAWTLGIQHAQSFANKPHLASDILNQQGTCCPFELTCSNVPGTGSSESWTYLFDSGAGLVEMVPEMQATSLGVLKRTSTSASTTMTTTRTQGSVASAPWSVRTENKEESSSSQTSESDSADVAVLIGCIVGCLVFCCCCVGCAIVIKLETRNETEPGLSRAQTLKFAASRTMRRNARQARDLATAVPKFIRSKTGNHVECSHQGEKNMQAVIPQKLGHKVAWEDPKALN